MAVHCVGAELQQIQKLRDTDPRVVQYLQDVKAMVNTWVKDGCIRQPLPKALPTLDTVKTLLTLLENAGEQKTEEDVTEVDLSEFSWEPRHFIVKPNNLSKGAGKRAIIMELYLYGDVVVL